MKRSDDDRGDGYDFSATCGGDVAGQLPDVVNRVMPGVQRSSGMWSFWAGYGNLVEQVLFLVSGGFGGIFGNCKGV